MLACLIAEAAYRSLPLIATYPLLVFPPALNGLKTRQLGQKEPDARFFTTQNMAPMFAEAAGWPAY